MKRCANIFVGILIGVAIVGCVNAKSNNSSDFVSYQETQDVLGNATMQIWKDTRNHNTIYVLENYDNGRISISVEGD